MARYKDQVETTGQALRDFAETLRLLSAQLERQADFMAESNLETVLTTHWATARDSAEGLARFAGAVQNAAIKARMMADLERMSPEKDDNKTTKKLMAKKKST